MSTLLLLAALIVNSLMVSAIEIQARISWYDPSLCDVAPINCFDPDTWWNMAAGHDAREWYGRALACPAEFPIGSIWRLPALVPNISARDWVCLDRGGAIRLEYGSNGQAVAVLDLLLPYAVYGETVRAIVFVERKPLLFEIGLVPGHSRTPAMLLAAVRENELSRYAK